MIKRISLITTILLVTTVFAYGASLEGGQIGNLYENPQGRSIVYDGSEIVNIWYTGSNSPQVGISRSTVGQHACIVFYENGAVIGNRFESSTYNSIDPNQATADTVDELVNIINDDSSSLWKAERGRDATPSTSTTNLLAYNVATPGSKSTSGKPLYNDTSDAHFMSAGFKATDGITYRLKRIEEIAQGSGAHYITVWDDSTCVYRRVYASKGQYAGEDYSGGSATNIYATQGNVTPLTISFNEDEGLCASSNKSLVVSSRWATTMAGDSVETENLSIIVGEFRH